MHAFVFFACVRLAFANSPPPPQVVLALLSNYCAPRGFAFYLLGLYALFLLVSCLVETGAIPESVLCSWLPYEEKHCVPDGGKQ